jgi:hypothetical protein
MTNPGGVKCLHKPGSEPWPKTNIVPSDLSPNSRATRETLQQFVQANTMRPLWQNEAQRGRDVEDALDTMTIAERIAIELEIQTRAPTVHTFDYDPLK